MSLSLREQLLKAGLVTEKQAKQAERARRASSNTSARRAAPPPAPTPEPQGRAAGAGRQAAARPGAQSQAAGEGRSARRAPPSCASWSTSCECRAPRATTTTTSSTAARSAASRSRPTCARASSRGNLAIVRCDGHYDLVPADAVERIRERDADGDRREPARPRPAAPHGG